MIGSALVGHLKSEGHTVQKLVRRPVVSSDEVAWDPKAGTIDLAALEGVDAIIHLAGAMSEIAAGLNVTKLRF
jgi:NAD dependent epimerase/dehydratase family enzyme